MPKLMLSERDRALALIALNSLPWSGGEDGIMKLYELREALGPEALTKRYGKMPIEDIPDAPVPLKLSADQVELLVNVLCGGGGGIKAQFAQHAAGVVRRIRRAAPKKIQKPEAPQKEAN